MVASIEDVAKAAGVSIATVSRALRGLPDVAAGTRDRVLAAASDLNYVAGLTVANLVIVKLGAAGAIDLFNAGGSTEVVVDVVGWYG